MLQVTERIGVHTPDEAAGSAVVVRLHPSGHGKGWGYEPDTRAAAAWLEERVRPGMTVADVGTGTGILAIVAAHLGATVTAYEGHAESAEIAARNFTLNGFAPDLRAAYDGEQGFDLVVANLGDAGYEAMGILTAGADVWTTLDFIAYGWAERTHYDDQNNVIGRSGSSTERVRVVPSVGELDARWAEEAATSAEHFGWLERNLDRA